MKYWPLYHYWWRMFLGCFWGRWQGSKWADVFADESTGNFAACWSWMLQQWWRSGMECFCLSSVCLYRTYKSLFLYLKNLSNLSASFKRKIWKGMKHVQTDTSNLNGLMKASVQLLNVWFGFLTGNPVCLFVNAAEFSFYRSRDHARLSTCQFWA